MKGIVIFAVMMMTVAGCSSQVEIRLQYNGSDAAQVTVLGNFYGVSYLMVDDEVVAAFSHEDFSNNSICRFKMEPGVRVLTIVGVKASLPMKKDFAINSHTYFNIAAKFNGPMYLEEVTEAEFKALLENNRRKGSGN